MHHITLWADFIASTWVDFIASTGFWGKIIFAEAILTFIVFVWYLFAISVEFYERHFKKTF
jgi:hypothetical protein